LVFIGKPKYIEMFWTEMCGPKSQTVEFFSTGIRVKKR